MLHKHVINELFNPTNETNVDISIYMTEISVKPCEAFLKHLRNLKGTTQEHLSSVNGNLSWKNSSEECTHHAMNASVVNDPCESIFGVATEDITTYKNIGLTHDGGIAMVKKNGGFNTGFKKTSKDRKLCFN